ncbi:MAG: hypothetical protein J0H09_24660, partial [Burkholderiales bacterium]|nr:hypothetical protein [Burkholderiales bacterium]
MTARIVVSSTTELEAAVRHANSKGGYVTIELHDGRYLLSQTLVVEAPHIALVSRSGRPADVVIAGDAMNSKARIGNLIRVAGSDFTLRGITLERSGRHLIQIAGENDVD